MYLNSYLESITKLRLKYEAYIKSVAKKTNIKLLDHSI